MRIPLITAISLEKSDTGLIDLEVAMACFSCLDGGRLEVELFGDLVDWPGQFLFPFLRCLPRKVLIAPRRVTQKGGQRFKVDCLGYESALKIPGHPKRHRRQQDFCGDQVENTGAGLWSGI